jgi:hypothetical protein
MTALASDLTDHVIPLVPVRQFVLSVPHRIRYLLAYDHGRCIAVLRIFIRALMSFYRQRATERGVNNGRMGSVPFLQRFGSAANLNVHNHVVVLDGLFTETSNGEMTFHPAEPPTRAELVELIAAVRTRILRYLKRLGLLDSDAANTDPLNDEAPVLASCYATSITGRQTIGCRKGAKLERIGADPDAPWINFSGATPSGA